MVHDLVRADDDADATHRAEPGGHVRAEADHAFAALRVAVDAAIHLRVAVGGIRPQDLLSEPGQFRIRQRPALLAHVVDPPLSVPDPAVKHEGRLGAGLLDESRER